MQPEKTKIFHSGESAAIGYRLAMVRKNLNLEQREVLDRISLSERSLNMISVFERGRAKKINADFLLGIVRLVAASGYSLKWFFLGQGPEKAEAVTPPGPAETLSDEELLHEIARRKLLPKLGKVMEELRHRLGELHSL